MDKDELIDLVCAAMGDTAMSMAYVKDVLAAIEKAGFVVVPREPTEAMLAAASPDPTHLYGVDGRGADYEHGMKVAVQVDRTVIAQRYRAMIEAATNPPD